MTYEMMFTITSRSIVYRAKKLIDNDMFLVMVKILFCCSYYNNVSVF